MLSVGAELCRWSKCDISQSYTTQGNKRDREAMFEELQDLIKH
uniref:Bm13492, isoform a n=1 Tax=Brugia malayi TaxID=6279 RepID=A0A1I9G7P4_BRUMA|nr:Bm13492, isoform a [Brugia malayi]